MNPETTGSSIFGTAGKAEGLEPFQVTQLLRAWADGQPEAQERLFELVYPELHRLASSRLSRQGSAVTLQATELAHETFLRLVAQRGCDWISREHFLAIAATTVRRVLLDYVKNRRRAKRGAGAVHLTLDEAMGGGAEISVDLLALDQALSELAVIRVTAARVVELRVFTGLSLDETARVLGLSRKTVQRRWRFARSWLAIRLEES